MYLNFNVRSGEELEIGSNLKLIMMRTADRPFVGTLWVPGNWLDWSADKRESYIKWWGWKFGLKGAKGQKIRWRNGEWKIEREKGWIRFEEWD